MENQDRGESCCSPAKAIGCCKVEAMVSVDERGQMVLPKDTRQKAGIRAGDKLALINWEKDGRICCMVLIKADEFAGMVKHFGKIKLDVLAFAKQLFAILGRQSIQQLISGLNSVIERQGISPVSWLTVRLRILKSMPPQKNIFKLRINRSRRAHRLSSGNPSRSVNV